MNTAKNECHPPVACQVAHQGFRALTRAPFDTYERVGSPGDPTATQDRSVPRERAPPSRRAFRSDRRARAGPTTGPCGGAHLWGERSPTPPLEVLRGERRAALEQQPKEDGDNLQRAHRGSRVRGTGPKRTAVARLKRRSENLSNCGLFQVFDRNRVAPCLTADHDYVFEIDEAEVIYWGRCPSCRQVPAATGAPGIPRTNSTT